MVGIARRASPIVHRCTSFTTSAWRALESRWWCCARLTSVRTERERRPTGPHMPDSARDDRAQPDPAELAKVDQLSNAVRDSLDHAKRRLAKAIDAVAACKDQVGEMLGSHSEQEATSAVEAVTTTLRTAHGAMDTLSLAVRVAHRNYREADAAWRVLSRKHDLVGPENFHRGRRLLNLRVAVASFERANHGDAGSRVDGLARRLQSRQIAWGGSTAAKQAPAASRIQFAARSLGDDLDAVRRDLELMQRQIGHELGEDTGSPAGVTNLSQAFGAAAVPEGSGPGAATRSWFDRLRGGRRDVGAGRSRPESGR